MPDWLPGLLGNYGYPVLFLVVFLNNAGLPLPGDTALLGAGLLAQQGFLSLTGVVITAALACSAGCTCGYWVGRRLGRKLMLRSHWRKMTPERVGQMDRFFKKHGPKTIFFSRFVALLHPVTGILAGVGKTPLVPFLAYNFAGSAVYSLVYGSIGYFFGQSWGGMKLWVGRGALYALVFLSVIVLLTVLLRRPVLALFAREAEKGSRVGKWLSDLRHKIHKDPGL